MKTTSKLGLLTILIYLTIATGLRAQLVAQTGSSDTALPAQPDSIVQITAEAQGLQAVAYNDLPLYGTYWEVMPGIGTMAPLPCPPFDPTLPIYSIAGNIFLVDATYGQVVVNPRQAATMSHASAVSAALDSEATAIVNLINQVQAAEAPSSGRSLTMATTMDSGGIPIPGGGTNSYSPDGLTNSYSPPDYGTNLWIAQTAVSSGYLNAVGSNTISDVLYEIQSRTNLMQTDWQSEGFFDGSELTNWTPFSVFQGGRTDLFLRLRSWADTYDIGIPDWWQFEYFGTNGIDPNASAAGDGYSNFQKFNMGLNPTNYYNPSGPPGFFGYLDATGTNVFIAWSPAPGPVVNYSIQRGVSNSLTGHFAFSQISTVSSNANFFEDVGAINNSNALNNLYQLAAVYPGGSFSATDTWQVIWFSQYGTLGAPYGPPAPTNFYACADTSATNVLLSWSPASSVATNYLIERGIYNSSSNAWVYHQIASISPATNSFTVSRPFTNSANWSDNYAIVAVYPGGVQAPWAVSPVNVGNTNGVAGPGNFFGYADGTGTNLVLTWTPAAGAPTNYIIFTGTTNAYGTCAYVKLTSVNGGATSLLVTNGYNNLYQTYAIFATYTNGGMSQAAFWQSANGTPAPGNFVAYLDATGTNVWLSWTAPTGAITGYILTRFDPLGDIFQYTVGTNNTWFEDTNAVNTGSFDPNYTEYTVQSIYPRGGVSATAIAMLSSVPAPAGLSATLDVTGKNVTVTWNAVLGATGYVIDRGVLNPAAGTYSYSQIATVGSGVTSYVDSGAIMTANSYNNHYKVAAIFPGGVDSAFDDSSVSESSDVPLSNVYLTANLIRNGSGRWQIMFSGLPTNSPQTVQLTWGEGYFPYVYPLVQTNLTTTNIAGGVFRIPDALALDLESFMSVDYVPMLVTAQLFGPNGEPGQTVLAGYFANDAPYFVDGRRHIKQNLQFLICAAARNQLFGSVSSDIIDGGQFNQTETSFEESSFLNHSAPGQEDMYFFQLDNLWPFRANYDLANYLVYTTGTNAPSVYTNFDFQLNFATNVPAPAILGLPAQYPILQPGFSDYLQNPNSGYPPSTWGISVNGQHSSASQSSGNNLFGLPYNNGYLISNTNGVYSYQGISSGGNVTVPAGYTIDDYASWCPAPTLSLVNYYFAPLINPGINVGSLEGVVLPGEVDPEGGANLQPFPLPIDEDFNVTNQTPPIIASVGQPMVIGGWTKYSVGSSGKYAYLGQYFQTNVFLLSSNGVVTTNTAGVMSPYGEFFPLQTGNAQFTTMPDIDNPSQQGTGVVSIVSMNVDANHDGTMDLSYSGPDQTSPSRPFRFWINDDTDSGDYGGDGIPGKGIMADITSDDLIGSVHGRRDLIDFFPVYLNVKGLLQTTTNVTIVLKQADVALYFLETSLTPTNYMNFLRDTNFYTSLQSTATLPIGPSGYGFTQDFYNNIRTNNGGIILVEACKATTAPLVMEIRQGTNVLSDTPLYLSISGVEQMFRNKNLMLSSEPGQVADRLTDASVPNEPDTSDKNFVFLHGYNVNPYQARGWNADIYKRLYWSGSHAKFYGVTWEAADSQVESQVTINLQTNIVNAFNTAPLLNSFLNSLSGTNVVAAHSLGNMLVLSTLNDSGNQSINTYFMIDAAVAIQAIDSSAESNPDMYPSAWTNYNGNLWASDWYGLFPTTDSRYNLNWQGRLDNLQNTAVYNYYSSGEEVLRDYPGDPPTSLIGIAVGQFVSLWNGNTGQNTWAWQEKLKGLMSWNGLLSSDHGGWQFNPAYNSLTVSQANALATTVLKTNAFFNWSSSSGSTPFTNDLALESSSGSTYAQVNRNRILSDAVPCLTLPVGANPIPDSGIVAGNSDMQAIYENGWPLGRGKSSGIYGAAAAGEWHHSDVRAVAYTFTYKLFNQMATVGNLK